MKENTNITEVAHNEINRLESINAELLEACEKTLTFIKTIPMTKIWELDNYIKESRNVLEQAINKAKGN